MTCSIADDCKVLWVGLVLSIFIFTIANAYETAGYSHQPNVFSIVDTIEFLDTIEVHR